MLISNMDKQLWTVILRVCLHDQNDINESTRTQLDAISAALAELQSKGPRQRPKRRIGFIQDEEK